MPTDEGFLGRECNGLGCGRYFRVHADGIQATMHCPYCGTRFSNDKLYTKSQVRYRQRASEDKAQEYMHGEISKVFGNLARQSRGNSFVKFEHKPTRYRARSVFPTYREQKVDSELVCPQCSFKFQVFGIFGFCPGCAVENILIYDVNLAIIRRDIEQSDNPRRSLRHAYSDLVSTFQIFCSQKGSRFEADKPSFQELFPSRKFFKECAGIDILADLADSDVFTLRKVFQKRHVCQHADGKITEQYIKKIPEDGGPLGQEAELSVAELEDAARVLGQVLDRLSRAFEPRS